MRKLKIRRALAIFLIVIMSLSSVGCENTDQEIKDSSSQTLRTNNAANSSSNSVETASNTENEAEELSVGEAYVNEATEELGLTDQQRNSFSMLYYLAIAAEEIRTSKDNRLILEDIYTSLLNDINPGAIDETTQEHLQNLRDIIKTYQGIKVKRDRLQYIYNQNKAAALSSAVPNPLAVLSVSNALNWKKLAATVAYTVVDSYTSYKKASASADTEYLTSGWELDDEETANITKNRDRAFDYMVDIVQEYDLDGKLTLNEENVTKFVEICGKDDNVQQKIRLLETEEGTYKLLGNYWLELADCYFETEEYKECLDCIDKYKALSIEIYRQDSNYVKILPKAIAAAQEVYTGQEYIDEISGFVDAIVDNTDKTSNDDWALRYYAAQVYLDLYSKSNRSEYLEKAYDIAYSNVAVLLDNQRSLNSTYLAKVNSITVDDPDEPDYSYMSKDEKKEAEKEYKEECKKIKAYNKSLKEKRKTELPTLYEPLILNCDLLYGLADELNISDKEKANIKSMLKIDSNGVFITRPVNDKYSFNDINSDYQCKVNKNEVAIPANLLSEGAEISLNISDGEKTTVCDDCKISEVERGDDGLDSFVTYVTSKKMQKYSWTKKTQVEIKIINGDEDNPTILKFKIKKYDKNGILPDTVEFEQQ